MKIRFVSHASFSVDSNGTTLLCDPWLFGKAFNQGWALLSPAATVPWEKIDYVWISHQHPDHLHFPTLKSLDTQQREHLTMLYQKHASQRIPRVLQGLGVFQRPGTQVEQVDTTARRCRCDMRLGRVDGFMDSHSR
jgi:UDP-MurNAc hydroxylase